MLSEIFYVKINLSLYLIFSACSNFLLHMLAVDKNNKAFLSLFICQILWSIIFLISSVVLKLKQHKSFMLGYSFILVWLGITCAAEIYYLNSLNVSLNYYYGHVGGIIYLMLFLTLHIYQYLQQISKK